MSIKLTETQLLLLSAGANRDDHCVAFPSGFKGGATKVAAKLLAAGLVKEVRAMAEMAVWRRDRKTGGAYSLRLTTAGAKTLSNHIVPPSPKGSEEDDAPTQVTATSAAKERETVRAVVAARADPGVSSPRGGTKIAQVVELIQRDIGATLDELVASTGGLPHTTRAALTGLRRRGYAVSIDRSDKKRGSTYRIGGDEKPGDAEIAPHDDVPSAAPRRSKRVEGVAVRQARKAA
jgi:hypothetical protein